MENHLKQSGKFANMKIQTSKQTPYSASVFPEHQRPMTSHSNQSLPIIIEINAIFEEFSRFFKDPLPTLSLIEPLLYSDLMTLKGNLGSILKVVKLVEKNTSDKINDMKRVNDRYLDNIEKENKDLKLKNRNLKEELDQMMMLRNKPTQLNSPKNDFIFYKNGVNFKSPLNFTDITQSCNKLSKENEELKEEIQYLNKQLKDTTNELEKLKEEVKSKNDQQLKVPEKAFDLKLITATRQNEKLTENIKLLEKDLKDKTIEIEKLKGELKLRDERVKNPQNRVANMKEAVNKPISFNAILLDQQTPKGTTSKGGPQSNKFLVNLKSRNSTILTKTRTEEDQLQETSKSALDFEEENQLLKAQLLSSQEEATRLQNTIKDLQSKLDLHLKNDQSILRGRTSNIQNSKAAQAKQETTEMESEEVRRLKDKLKDKKTQIRSLSSQIEKEKDEKEDIKKRLSSTKRKYKREKEEKQNLETNLEALLKEKEEEEERLRKQIEKYPMPKIKSKKSRKVSKPYDIIINIDSLKAREIGWKIEHFNDSDIDMRREYSVIGLVGPEKSGKTFLLNKLCDLGLPEKMSTKGLSVKYTDIRNLACLDSAGMQRPVEYYKESMITRYNGISEEDIATNQEIKQKMLNDRILTDIFIQDFILESSEVILIVVGPLTQDDQKLIERISRKYKLKKKIVIVHNFANIWDKKTIEERIESDIKRAFHTIERNIPNSDIKEYIEKKQEKELENNIHLVLGAENQDSGFKYNDVTIKYLQEILDTRTEKRRFNILNELKEFLKENYRLYLQFKKTPKQFGLESLAKDEENVLVIKTDQDYEASNPIFNSLGFMITNPPYEVFIRQNCYIVLIELPDLNFENLKIRLDKKKTEIICLIVEGIKFFASYGKGDNEAITGNRKCGDFTCVIPLGTGLLKIKPLDSKKDYDAGVLRIIVDKNEEEEEKL